MVAKYVEATHLKLDWDGNPNDGCEHAVMCDPNDSLSYVLDINTGEQRDVLHFYDMGYNIGIVDWSSPLEVGHTYHVQMHGQGDYHVSQDFVYAPSTPTNVADGVVLANPINVSASATNPVLSLFNPELPALDQNCLLNGADDISVDVYVNGVNRQTFSGNCTYGVTGPGVLDVSTSALFGSGNYNIVVHSASTGNTWHSNDYGYTAPPPFGVSNFTFDHSTRQYSFNYVGYTGGDITGESVAIHADGESWGYNHEPATCTGGSSGSGTCTGTLNLSQGTFSCATTLYVQIYGYHVGNAVTGLADPDPACIPQPIHVDSTEWINPTTFRIHYSNNQHPGDPIGLIYVEGDGSFHAGAWGWSDSQASGYVDFGAQMPGQPEDFSNLYWGAEAGYTRWYELTGTNGASTQFRLQAYDATHYTTSNVMVNHTTGNFSFDYSGYNGGNIVAVSLQNNPAASIYNWVAGQIGYGPLSCTSTYCTGSAAHVAGVMSCTDTLEFAIYDGSNVYYSQNYNVADVDPTCNPNQAPVVTFTANSTTLNEGDTFTGSGSFTDPDSTGWTATVDYGDGTSVHALVLNPDNTFNLSHVYVDNGSYTITVSVTDNGGLSGTSTGSGGGVVVNNPAPVVPPITPPSNSGQGGTTVINVPFSDYGNQGHTATVNWGDGSGDQSVPVSGSDFSSGHTYTAPGTYTVTVTVTDSQGATTTQTLTITVLNVAPTLGTINFPGSVAVNSPNSLSVNFTDPGTIDTHTATINWGDGHTTNGTVTESHGSGSVSGNHTYTAPGPYTVTVTVTDNNGGAGNKTFSTTAVNQLSALNPAGIWIGLKNSDDVGTKFDLKVDAYSGSTLVASGELDSFAGGSSGFNNAHLASIPFSSFAPVSLPSGTVLNLTVSVRNACVGSGHTSGTARLWYNDSDAASYFGTTVAGSNASYYLRDAFGLATTAGPGPKKTVDVQAGAKCSAFKPFGTWSTTL
ncbi:MAG TPA: PKD domain-containing protein [Candidatus Saccharimonadales bacterium]|nr:PKD domain-containing protein [Candidatus Saccharimonadales bacterium]